MTMTKAIARAWTDADYKAKPLSDPHAALAEAAEAGELSIEELDRPAGGYLSGKFQRLRLDLRIGSSIFSCLILLTHNQ